MLDTLLSHNAWAIARLIDRCRSIPPGEFTREFPIGPGSLQATLTHLIEAMEYYAARFSGVEYAERPGFQDRARSPDGLRALLDEADARMRASIASFMKSHALDDAVPGWLIEGRPVPTRIALAQVFDHGSHHRSQCINMLRRLERLNGLETDPLTMLLPA